MVIIKNSNKPSLSGLCDIKVWLVLEWWRRGSRQPRRSSLRLHAPAPISTDHG